MSLVKILTKACAPAALTAALATPAFAAFVQGGGSSLLAPVMAQIYCADTNCSTPAKGTDHARLFGPIPILNGMSGNHDTINTFDYLLSNSAGGQSAILTADQTKLGIMGGISITNYPFPGPVSLGYSDAPLSNAALVAYGSGLSGSPYFGVGGGLIGDLSIALKGSDGSGSGITNPRASGFGELIQFPVTIDPVAISYNPTGLGLGTNRLKLDKTT
ncbi:MAG TPA: hypothetical protein VGM42_15605 [Rhodopila sp.]|jgi:hypothetical protein